MQGMKLSVWQTVASAVIGTIAVVYYGYIWQHRRELWEAVFFLTPWPLFGLSAGCLYKRPIVGALIGALIGLSIGMPIQAFLLMSFSRGPG
jgi:hypothetical protein